MSNVTLNVAGDVSFNCLNLSASGTWTQYGNFSFVQNNSYSTSSGSEYGTICIGTIQIKFGYISSIDNGQAYARYSNYFPNNGIVAATTSDSSGYDYCSVYYNGVDGLNIRSNTNCYWIAIGN